PEPLRMLDDGRMTLPIGALSARCASWRVDFAAKGGGLPRKVEVDAGHVATKSLGEGTLGVSCQPKAPRWVGPVQWFLAPIGSDPDKAALPAEDALMAGLSDVPTTLASWINRLRREA